MAEEQIYCTMSEHAQFCVARLQEVMSEFDLTATDGMLAAGEFFAWAHLLGMIVCDDKQATLAQIDRSAAAARQWADDNYASFRARFEVVRALDAGDSGGRMQ